MTLVRRAAWRALELFGDGLGTYAVVAPTRVPSQYARSALLRVSCALHGYSCGYGINHLGSIMAT